MIFPEEMKIEAAEAYRQNILVPGIEHVIRNDWIGAWCCGVRAGRRDHRQTV